MALPMALTGTPGPTTSMAASRARRVPLTRRRLSASTSPTKNMAGCVAVRAVEVHGHVDVHDVTGAQRAAVGNPVADDLVHRRADGLREGAVAEGAGVGAPVEHLGVDNRVDGVCGNAWRHVPAGDDQHLCSGRARAAHGVDLRRRTHRSHARRPGFAAGVADVRRAGDPAGHRTRRTHDARLHRRDTQLRSPLALRHSPTPPRSAAPLPPRPNRRPDRGSPQDRRYPGPARARPASASAGRPRCLPERRPWRRWRP